MEEEGFVPDDPLDRAQEWEFLVEGEEKDDEDFAGFQVDWKTDGYMPRNPKQFTRKLGPKQSIAVDETLLGVFSRIIFMRIRSAAKPHQIRSGTPSPKPR